MGQTNLRAWISFLKGHGETGPPLEISECLLPEHCSGTPKATTCKLITFPNITWAYFLRPALLKADNFADLHASFLKGKGHQCISPW